MSAPMNAMNSLVTSASLIGEGTWLHRIWFKPGNSNLTADVDWMFMFILWVSIISFFILMIPMTFWAFKYRRRAGVPAQRTPNHNLFLEITWVVVPMIIMTVMFFKGFHSFMDGQIAAGNAEELVVTGQRWIWSVKYPNEAISPVTVRFDVSKQGDGILRGIKDMPLFVVPAGRPIKMKFMSTDVIHSFFIPDMRIKIDVMPNRYTSFSFTPLSFEGPQGVSAAVVDTGTNFISQLDSVSLLENKKDTRHRDHIIYCAEYCGQDHSEMAGVLRVVPQEDYDAIKAQWGDIDSNIMKDPVALGVQVSKVFGCGSCHSIDGKANSGPTWLNAYGRPVEFEPGVKGLEFAAEFGKDPFLAWDNYIRESVLRPQSKIHKGFTSSQMASFDGQLNEVKIQALTAYYRSLSEEWKAKHPGEDAGATIKAKALEAEAEKKAALLEKK